MYNIAAWQRLLSYVGVIGTMVLLAKLYSTGLARVYRWFTRFLILGMIASCSLLVVGRGTNAYAMTWFCSKPLEWLLSLAVLLEIYSLVMARYPGIASLMRWAVIAAAGIAFTVSMLSLSIDFHSQHEKFPILRCAFAVQRTVDATLALSLLIPWLLMTRFPITLCRNVVIHCMVFSASVGLEAGLLFARNVLGTGFNQYTNLIMMTGNSFCLLAWILFLTKKGEMVEHVVRTRRDPETERLLIAQLGAFNQALLRAVPGTR